MDRCLIVCIVLCVCGVSNPARADDARDLIAKTWQRYRGVRTERESIDFLILEPAQAEPYTLAAAKKLLHDGAPGVIQKRAVRYVLYANDWNDKTRIVFSLPAVDAGLSFLVLRQPRGAQDDMWLYMPGYKRVRRVSLGASRTLAGTTLFYEDVRDLAGEWMDAYDYARSSVEDLDGRRCQVIEATPRSGARSVYSGRRIWIDTERLFPLKVEYNDAAGTVWKQLRSAEVYEIRKDVWRPKLLEMRNLQRNTVTVMLFSERQIGVEIDDQVFAKDAMTNALP